ncbi:MAG: GIY-YIG nuclease family protein [Terriglobia bacterium]|jgi:putative endonuclease
MKTYYVYIMSNNSRTLYTGVTNDLERRVFEHKRKLLPGFTRQYNINRLVYYESCGDIRAAIQREKQMKGWVRAKKVALIVSVNHAWKDLSEGWYGKDNCRDSSPAKKRRAQNDMG